MGVKVNVVAIFKRGLKSLPSNYKAVNLTSIVGKILESLINNNLEKLLLKNNILSNNLH